MVIGDRDSPAEAGKTESWWTVHVISTYVCCAEQRVHCGAVAVERGVWIGHMGGHPLYISFCSSVGIAGGVGSRSLNQATAYPPSWRKFSIMLTSHSETNITTRASSMSMKAQQRHISGLITSN